MSCKDILLWFLPALTLMKTSYNIQEIENSILGVLEEVSPTNTTKIILGIKKFCAEYIFP